MKSMRRSVLDRVKRVANERSPRDASLDSKITKKFHDLKVYEMNSFSYFIRVSLATTMYQKTNKLLHLSSMVVF